MFLFRGCTSGCTSGCNCVLNLYNQRTSTTIKCYLLLSLICFAPYELILTSKETETSRFYWDIMTGFSSFIHKGRNSIVYTVNTCQFSFIPVNLRLFKACRKPTSRILFKCIRIWDPSIINSMNTSNLLSPKCKHVNDTVKPNPSVSGKWKRVWKVAEIMMKG